MYVRSRRGYPHPIPAFINSDHQFYYGVTINMAKKTKSYMIRRGRRYLIERTPEGTFARWISTGIKKSAKKVSAKTSSSKSMAKHTHGKKSTVKKSLSR